MFPSRIILTIPIASWGESASLPSFLFRSVYPVTSFPTQSGLSGRWQAAIIYMMAGGHWRRLRVTWLTDHQPDFARRRLIGVRHWLKSRRSEAI
jgi:hypothetical protein